MQQARIYVSTYGKYNAGSLDGAWLDLEDFADAEDFAEACAKLHGNEHDPEIMFQDYEGFPAAFYGESHLDPRVWDWINAEDFEREIWAAYLDNVNADADLVEARDAYAGEGDSEVDWAQQLLAEVPENLRYYFDWDAWVRDYKCDGMTFVRVGGRVLAFHA